MGILYAVAFDTVLDEAFALESVCTRVESPGKGKEDARWFCSDAG